VLCARIERAKDADLGSLLKGGEEKSLLDIILTERWADYLTLNLRFPYECPIVFKFVRRF